MLCFRYQNNWKHLKFCFFGKSILIASQKIKRKDLCMSKKLADFYKSSRKYKMWAKTPYQPSHKLPNVDHKATENSFIFSTLFIILSDRGLIEDEFNGMGCNRQRIMLRTHCVSFFRENRSGIRKNQFQNVCLPLGHWHRWLGGMPLRTISTCLPQPSHEVFLHRWHWIFQHIL